MLHMQQAKIYVQAPHAESASVLAFNDRLDKVQLQSKDLKERVGKVELDSKDLKERMDKMDLENKDLKERMGKLDLEHEDLKERIGKVELDSKDLKERMGKLESAEQRLDKIALRRLLHMSRHKLAGGELPADHRSTWNTRIQAGLVPAPPGVSVKAVQFTKFGPGNGQLQEVGDMAACDFSTASIAEAVMSQPVDKRVLYSQLFKMCFNASVDDVLVALLPSDDEEC